MSKRKMSKGSVTPVAMPVASEVRVNEDEFMGCFKTKELAERFGKVFRDMSEQEQEEMVVNHERIGILRQLYMEGRDDMLTVVFLTTGREPQEHCLWPFALAEAAAPVLGPKSRYMYA